jgi:hypothetical protein
MYAFIFLYLGVIIFQKIQITMDLFTHNKMKQWGFSSEIINILIGIYKIFT